MALKLNSSFAIPSIAKNSLKSPKFLVAASRPHPCTNIQATVREGENRKMALKFTSSFPIQSIARNGLKSPKFLMASSLHPCTKEEQSLKKPLIHHQMEIFKTMEDWAEKNVLVHLKPVEKSWQPHDFLPDPASDGFQDHIRELKESAREIPDDYFVVLVGDMITEEAVSTYQTVLNSVDGVKDETGSSLSPWAKWNRGWTAEENRHGDLLNKYIYLSGRVDMRAIEKTIQYLIGSGMDIEIGNNAYNLYIYTSFQERATNISHRNTAKHAKHYGNTKLAKICGTIASDEKRHEVAYTTIVKKLFQLDPDGAVQAFATMMRRKITMPAHFLYDGRDHRLFDHFSAVAQRLGVYTARDYADILEFLVGMWEVGELVGLSPEGRRAQDYVCELAPKIRRVQERAQERAKRAPSIPFSWIHGREVQL